MKSNVNNLGHIGVKIYLMMISISTLLLFLTLGTISRTAFLNIVSWSIVLTSIILVIIEKIFWKKILLYFSKHPFFWQFLEKYEVPILKERYTCIIKYEWQGIKGQKKVEIDVNQTYTNIEVIVRTDEIRSDSVISEITKENNTFVLYYIYRTNPKSEFSESNPSQLGGCRIDLDSITKINANDKLEGKYWTTSKTIGDMDLY